MILITGGTGFIGSHTAVAFLEAGFEVLLLDNLSNSTIDVIARIERITHKAPTFIQGDIRDTVLLAEIFKQHDITCVIHCAGLKAVAISVVQPLSYYDNNVYGSLCLFKAM